ncbi:hypothetical protein C8D88_12127 [Lentzea atacamensis]|uniref:Uncharacterized protein n=1 Tax=Lentzea atacamensis TaxID=531938 RepID=A0A316HI37_9PSEU|nr:hypothetical protein [Lentzea atacamensis]PWK80857.1 hypothetical protein C8D88_12127 [Lentzea atacamensis]
MRHHDPRPPGNVPGLAYTTADLKRRAEFSATASTAQGDPTAAYWKVVNEVFC